MSVVHLMVPGLARRHLDGLLAHGVLAQHPPQRRADLVVSFPATCANVEATLLSGRTALGRGTVARVGLGPGTHALAGIANGVEVGTEPGPATRDRALHRVLDGLQEALVLEGHGSTGERRALEELDRILGAFLVRAAALVLSGAPALQAVSRSVTLPEELRAACWTEGALAGLPAGVSPEMQEALLRQVGVERVLQGEALESWGAPAGAGAIVLAEPGASFTPGHAANGHREILDPDQTPVFLAWGVRTAAAWPPAVHDYRVGPTLTAALGLRSPEGDSAALPW